MMEVLMENAISLVQTIMDYLSDQAHAHTVVWTIVDWNGTSQTEYIISPNVTHFFHVYNTTEPQFPYFMSIIMITHSYSSQILPTLACVKSQPEIIHDQEVPGFITCHTQYTATHTSLSWLSTRPVFFSKPGIYPSMRSVITQLLPLWHPLVMIG